MIKKFELGIKYIFDLVLATISLVFAIPIIMITAIIIKIYSPEASPFFRQIRIGYRGKKFVICKLRSMTNEKDKDGNLLPDEVRLKKWGKIVRKLSIDELPQIFLIITRKMSWIGPRPLLSDEMKVMSEYEQRERQSMLPGITGWEAVNEEKTNTRRGMAEYDLYYVRNWSLLLDIKIFVMTVKKLLHADRADEEHRAPKLKGEELHNNK